MIIQIDNYVAEIEDNSILVLPATKRARVQKTQLATFAEVYSLSPAYVREAVARKICYGGLIYLIHFDTPYKHAKHYLGFTKNLDQRLLRHEAGRGARLMQVVEEAGISWLLVKVWYGDRYEERRLKRLRNSPRLCPICNPTRKEVTKLW